VLGVADASQLDANKGFFDLGLDSIMALEFKNRLQHVVGNELKLDLKMLFDYPNILKVSQLIARKLADTSMTENVCDNGVANVTFDNYIRVNPIKRFAVWLLTLNISTRLSLPLLLNKNKKFLEKITEAYPSARKLLSASQFESLLRYSLCKGNQSYFHDLHSKFKDKTLFVHDHCLSLFLPMKFYRNNYELGVLDWMSNPLVTPLNINFEDFDMDSLNDPVSPESSLLKYLGEYVHPKYTDNYLNNLSYCFHNRLNISVCPDIGFKEKHSRYADIDLLGMSVFIDMRIIELAIEYEYNICILKIKDDFSKNGIFYHDYIPYMEGETKEMRKVYVNSYKSGLLKHYKMAPNYLLNLYTNDVARVMIEKYCNHLRVKK